MTEAAFDRIIAHYESITLYAQLVTASAIINIVCWLVLIYASFKLRQAARDTKRAAEIISGLTPPSPNALPEPLEDVG